MTCLMTEMTVMDSPVKPFRKNAQENATREIRRAAPASKAAKRIPATQPRIAHQQRKSGTS